MIKFLYGFIILVLSWPLLADPRGEEIARRNINLAEANDSHSLMVMVLVDRQNRKKMRKLDYYAKKTENGTNTFIRFLEPADLKGTSFLTIGYEKGDDEQRLYLPSLGKARRISSSNKGGKFMGSDLYFFDLEDRGFDDSDYEYLKDDIYNDMSCHLVATYPKDKDAPYSKQILWINKDNWFAYKIESFDKKRKDRMIKTIVMLDVKDYNGVLIPEKIVVDNHKDNHKTLLQRQDIKVNVGLKDDIFTVQNLTK